MMVIKYLVVFIYSLEFCADQKIARHDGMLLKRLNRTSKLREGAMGSLQNGIYPILCFGVGLLQFVPLCLFLFVNFFSLPEV